MAENLIERSAVWLGNGRRHLSLAHARLRFRLTNLRTKLSNLSHFSGLKIEAVTWFVVSLSLVVVISRLHFVVRPLFANESFVEVMSATALQIGGALLGATAIVASLVLFAMQVNVERLPHGLFRRLSTDKHLLAYFVASFVASITIACLPLVTPIARAEWAVLIALLLTAFTLRLFLAAYKRALKLINPIQQLGIVIDDVTKALRRWGKQADWYTAALSSAPSVSRSNPTIASTVDTSRAAFMLQNDWGARLVIQGIDYCRAACGKAASQGDYEVANSALRAIISINAAYMRAKGRTFFAENGFVEVPLATDRVINQTLEQLKREFRSGVGKRDEEHVNMLINAYGDLAQLYMQIDYGGPEIDPWHAALAIGYLMNDVKSIALHNLPDCMMQGVRTMGGCAVALLNHDRATDIVPIVDELGLIGAAMAVQEDHRPVTATALHQLAGLTYRMISAGVFNPAFSLGQIGKSVELIAKVLLSQPNTALASIHRMPLAPFFSPTTQSSLSYHLKGHANSLLKVSDDDTRAGDSISNLCEWAERSRPMAKQVLILAIQNGSRFAFDIMHWIGDIVEVLLTVSRSPASQPHFVHELEVEADRWTSLLSWIPDDPASLDCAATWSATTVMFNVAGVARTRGSQKVYETAQRTLLGWAMRPSRRENAWHDVGQAMLASVALAVKSPDDDGWGVFKARLLKALKAEALPSAELLNGAAVALRRANEDYSENALRTRDWDHVLRSLEPNVRLGFLFETAEMLEGAASHQP